MASFKKIVVSTLLAFTLISTATAYAEENGEWKNTVYIYGWLPSLDGSMEFSVPGRPGEPDQSAESDFLDNIDAVFMASYTLKKDKWSFLADYLYLSASDSNEGSISLPPTLNRPAVNVASSTELTTWLLSLYGGYNVVDTGSVTLDVIGGIRYLSFEVDVAFAINDRHISLSPSIELYDGVIGVNGQIEINENWYGSYLIDIGGGDSELTYQAMVGAGYRFGWGDIIASYRYLHYEEDGLIQEFNLYGPKVGVVFHF